MACFRLRLTAFGDSGCTTIEPARENAHEHFERPPRAGGMHVQLLSTCARFTPGKLEIGPHSLNDSWRQLEYAKYL